jgi:hypothetical protein
VTSATPASQKTGCAPNMPASEHEPERPGDDQAPVDSRTKTGISRLVFTW